MKDTINIVTSFNPKGWETYAKKMIDSVVKYMADDLFHSLADLLNITSNEVEFTRSIFHKDFKERKRIIKDIVNYDTFFD